MIVTPQAVLRLLAAAAVMALGIGQAQAETYNFSQSFGSFGTVSGQFTGTDTGVVDGILDFDDGEISFQSLVLSGGPIDLSFGPSDIYVQVGKWVIGDTGVISNPMSGFEMDGYPSTGTGLAMYWIAGEAASVGLDEGYLVVYDAQTNVDVDADMSLSGTNVNVAPVTAVPEPESYLMMALGLAGLAAAAKRRQRA